MLKTTCEIEGGWYEAAKESQNLIKNMNRLKMARNQKTTLNFQPNNQTLPNNKCCQLYKGDNLQIRENEVNKFYSGMYQVFQETQKYAKNFQLFKVFYYKLLHVFADSVENTGVL